MCIPALRPQEWQIKKIIELQLKYAGSGTWHLGIAVLRDLAPDPIFTTGSCPFPFQLYRVKATEGTPGSQIPSDTQPQDCPARILRGEGGNKMNNHQGFHMLIMVAKIQGTFLTTLGVFGMHTTHDLPMTATPTIRNLEPKMNITCSRRLLCGHYTSSP